MAAPQRKRIYGRVQPNIDERTSGIQSATRGERNLGDLHSSQVVHVGVDKSRSAWASFLSDSLGAIKEMGMSIYTQKRNEEERLRLKAENEMEKRLDALQAWEAHKWELGLKGELSEEIEAGRISSSDQLTRFIQERTVGLDHTQDSAFIQAAIPGLKKTLDEAQTLIATKANNEFNVNILGKVRDGLYKELDTQDFNTPEGHEAFKKSYEDGLLLWTSAGRTTAEYDGIVIECISQAARNANLSDPGRRETVLSIGERITGAREKMDTLRTELEHAHSIQADKDEFRAKRDEDERLDKAVFDFHIGLSGKTEEELLSLQNKIIGDPDDFKTVLGEAGTSRALELIEGRLDRITRMSAVGRQQLELDSGRKKARYQTQIMRGNIPSNQEIDESGMVEEDIAYIAVLKSSEEAKAIQTRLPVVTELLTESLERHAQNVKVQGLDSPLSDSQQGNLLAQAMEAANIAAQGTFPEGAIGENQKNDAIRKAVDDVVKNIIDNTPETRYRDPLDTSGNLAFPVKGEYATLEEYRSSPATQQDFKKNLFAGTDMITVGAAKSGRPYEVKFNRKYYDSITDTKMKDEANKLIRQEQAEQLIRETNDSWYGITRTTDEVREDEWRARQIGNTRGSGGGPKTAAELRRWFEAVDDHRPVDESFRPILPKPELP